MVVDDDRFSSGMFGSAEVDDSAYTGEGGWDAVAGLWSGSHNHLYWLSQFYKQILTILSFCLILHF